MSCTAGTQKPPSSVTNRNPPKPCTPLARWSGSRRRRRRAEPSGGIVLRAPPIPPQCPECCGNPRLLRRGTGSSNPSPSSGESHQRTELGEFRPRESGFPMVSSRSFGNDHLIDRLAAGIAGAAGRISTDSLADVGRQAGATTHPANIAVPDPNGHRPRQKRISSCIRSRISLAPIPCSID